jgi:hypothetical protein
MEHHAQALSKRTYRHDGVVQNAWHGASKGTNLGLYV